MSKHYSDQELLSIIQHFYDEHQRVPKIRELPVSKEVYRLRFGSYGDAIRMLNLSPNRRVADELLRVCMHCGTEFRSTDKHSKYCSHSCRASATNTARERSRKIPTTPCVMCGVMHTNRVYCSDKCQSDHIKVKYEAGELLSRPTLRKRVNASCCMSCGLSEWQGVPLPLELDHIDGNARNNNPSNLRMICPNCHSITPTWKSRNKGSGRKARGLPTS